MTEPEQIREFLEKLPAGAQVTVKKHDGTEVAGTYKGTEDDKVQLEDRADGVQLGDVETVLMDVSSPAGPE